MHLAGFAHQPLQGRLIQTLRASKDLQTLAFGCGGLGGDDLQMRSELNGRQHQGLCDRDQPWGQVQHVGQSLFSQSLRRV